MPKKDKDDEFFWVPVCVTAKRPCGGAVFAKGEPCSYCGQREFDQCKTMNMFWKCDECTCWKDFLNEK